MFNACIERYDTEVHGVVVGIAIDDEVYRRPVFTFWREGDARMFCNAIKAHGVSDSIRRRLLTLAEKYEREGRYKLVDDIDLRVRDGLIDGMTIKRRRER